MVQIYYNNEWTDWKYAGLKNLILFNKGDICFDTTGGWNYTSSYGSQNSGSITNTINLSGVGTSMSDGNCNYETKNTIDSNKYSKIIVEYESLSLSNDSYIAFTTSKSNGELKATSPTSGTVEFALTNKGITTFGIYLSAKQSTCSIKIKRITFEK